MGGPGLFPSHFAYHLLWHGYGMVKVWLWCGYGMVMDGMLWSGYDIVLWHSYGAKFHPIFNGVLATSIFTKLHRYF
jgi:hypothetical protein